MAKSLRQGRFLQMGGKIDDVKEVEIRWIYKSIIMLDEITVKKNIKGLAELLIFDSSIQVLIPFVRVHKHFVLF